MMAHRDRNKKTRMRYLAIVAAFGAALNLPACVDDMDGAGDMVSADMPDAAEQACLRDVTPKTGNADVTLLGSEFCEAGTLVRLGVGPDRAPCQCIAYSDGTTAGIESLTDEGALRGLGHGPVSQGPDLDSGASSRSRPAALRNRHLRLVRR